MVSVLTLWLATGLTLARLMDNPCMPLAQRRLFYAGWAIASVPGFVLIGVGGLVVDAFNQARRLV